MFMDLDGFKTVNDTYGHHIGDLLLVEVARRIESSVRQEDTIARVGGDEFVLLARVGEPADAATLADKVSPSFANRFRWPGARCACRRASAWRCIPATASISTTCITNADAAMYHAKALGRNVYCFFETSMNAIVHEQLQLVQDLRPRSNETS